MQVRYHSSHLETLAMFRNLFGSRRPSESTSRPRFRPHIEVLEDRTTPAVVTPFVTTDSLLIAISTNPALSNANALLNNQLAGEINFLTTPNPANLTQTLTSQLVNNFVFGSFSPQPNALGNLVLLVQQETLLSASVVLVSLNPGLGTNPLFTQSVTSLATSIASNPQFGTGFNNFGPNVAFSAGALAFDFFLGPFLPNNTAQSFNPTIASTGIGTTIVTPTLGLTTFPATNSAASLASFGFGSTPSGTSPVTFGFNVATVGFSTQQFGFGSVLTV
jgi:hypothetical protein